MEVLSKTNGFTSGSASALPSTRLSMPPGLAANESTTGFRNHFYDDGRKVPLFCSFIKTSLPICSYRSYHREFEAPEGAFPVASLPQAYVRRVTTGRVAVYVGCPLPTHFVQKEGRHERCTENGFGPKEKKSLKLSSRVVYFIWYFRVTNL